MSFEGKIAVLTGTDRIGKETQSGLLQYAMRRAGIPCAHMSFPEYGEHWAAEMVRATLNEEFVTIHREGGLPLQFYPRKNPYIFQMWQSADRIDKQDWINETLKTSHIVADRYEIDALAYGLVDGCREAWLFEMNELYRPSDLAIVLIGTPFPRPGETPDLNERDPVFQAAVRDAYVRLCHGNSRYHLLNVDHYRRDDPILSKFLVHEQLCLRMHEFADIFVPPLSLDAIRALEAARRDGWQLAG